MANEQESFKDKLIKLSSPDYHESIGILPKWRIGDQVSNGINEIYPYYDADQCEEIFDNVLGIDGWGCEYREVAGILFCAISIFTESNGMVEKSDGGGARASRKKSISDTDKQTFEAKTAATGAFVRAAARWGVGRHLNILPKIRLAQSNGVCKTPKGELLKDPEELAAWCNQTSPAIKHLIAAYQLCRASFDANQEAVDKLTDLRKFIEAGFGEKGGAK